MNTMNTMCTHCFQRVSCKLSFIFRWAICCCYCIYPSHNEPIKTAIYGIGREKGYCVFHGLVWTVKNLTHKIICAYKLSSTSFFFCTSKTCQCSIFKLSHKDSCQIWRAHCLSLVQSAAVCAANKCVQTAQLEEGGKGEVHTINCRVRSKLTRLWYAYRNALADFMLTCFCTICLESTRTTGTD